MLQEIQAVEDCIARQPWITKTFSLAGLRSDLNRLKGLDPADRSPRSDLTWRVALTPPEEGTSALVPDWVRQVVRSHFSRDEARIRVLSREIHAIQLQNGMNDLRDSLAEAFPDRGITLTGMVRLVIAMQNKLISSQLQSFALAFAMILTLFLVLFRSAILALVAMIPNLLPLAATIVLITLWGEPLNAATIMIASITMGIAVDAAIHYCFAWIGARRDGLPPPEACDRATRETAPAIVTAMLVISFGFLSLAFASFKMVAIFGILVSFVMITAMLADLIVVPALLRRVWGETALQSVAAGSDPGESCHPVASGHEGAASLGTRD